MASNFGHDAEGFGYVYQPKKASCLNADGSCDYAKVNELLAAAQAWDEQALMLAFEQYQSVWQGVIGSFQSHFVAIGGWDYEDLMQEAFCSYLVALKKFGRSRQKNFKEFLKEAVKHDFLDILDREITQLHGKGFKCSLDERDEEGNLLYDLPDRSAEELYFKDYYPRVKKLLDRREFQVAIARFVWGYANSQIAKALGVTRRTVDHIITSIKDKLCLINRD